MISRNTRLMLQTAGLSALAGMRTMSGPALLSGDKRFFDQSSLASPFLESRTLTLTVKALAVGEVIADKLPFMPRRTWLPALIVRSISGAVMGASVYNLAEEPPLPGAVIGCISAVLAAHVSYNIRRTLTKTFHVPDLIVALAEDTLIISCGRKLLADQFVNGEETATQL